jgi:hypothetical protein
MIYPYSVNLSNEQLVKLLKDLKHLGVGGLLSVRFKTESGPIEAFTGYVWQLDAKYEHVVLTQIEEPYASKDLVIKDIVSILWRDPLVFNCSGGE